MSSSRTLYYLAWSDFHERTRRPSFLITLAAVIFIAYAYFPPKEANSVTFNLGSYRGIYNSAWVGAVIAVLCSALLSIPGFFLVKNTIERDIETRVGQILATTPISRLQYILGKLISNFVFLLVMAGVITASALVMQLVRGEVMTIDLWQYIAPFLFITLPVMLLVSAIAILFEVIPWLRGGFGNILYLALYLAVVMISLMPSQKDGLWFRRPEPFGLTVLAADMSRDVKAVYPAYNGGLVIGATSVRGPIQTFVWDGVHWDASIALLRFLWVGVVLGIALLASLLFSRFDPTVETWKGKKARRMPDEDEEEDLPAISPVGTTSISVSSKLTPVSRRNANLLSLLARALNAEIRLMLKGARWWWYAVAAAIVLAGLFAVDPSMVKGTLLAGWIWPVLIWSGLGCREKRCHTEGIVFSAPHPLLRQLPATWMSGLLLALLMACGPALHALMAGNLAQVFAILTGAVFIPSLAIAMGIWSGGSKLFEVTYLLLWYVGPVSGAPALDFSGLTPESIRMGTAYYFLAASAVLLALSFLGRRRQMMN